MQVREPSKNKIYWNPKRTVSIFWDKIRGSWIRKNFRQVIDETETEIGEVDAAYHTTTMDSEVKDRD